MEQKDNSSKEHFYTQQTRFKPIKKRHKRKKRTAAKEKHFDEKIRLRRRNNRGFKRFIHKMKRDKESRMRVLWTLAVILFAIILGIAIWKDIKWRRAEKEQQLERSSQRRWRLELKESLQE